MKQMPMVFCLILCAVLAGCTSKELTRGKAAELIKAAKFGPTPTQAEPRIFLLFANSDFDVNTFNSDQVVPKLESAGLVLITRHECSNSNHA